MPANLRFGRKKDNTAIGYRLDPMGGLTDQITDKEEDMALENYVCEPPIVGQYAIKERDNNWACRTSSWEEKMT